MKFLPGRNLFDNLGTWLPNETVEAFRTYLIGIKGPLTTPVGGGIRSLNVTLRQDLDLFVCLRPVRYFNGIETPVKAPEKVNMVVFRENTEDIYAGIEFKEGTEDAKLFFDTMSRIFPDRMKKVRFPESSGFGIKPVSREGTERLVRAAIDYAVKNGRKSVTLVHKGNIMKFTEGGFRDWGYDVARREYGALPIGDGPWLKLPNGIVIKDCIADAFLQEILLHPENFDVVATLNLNGDYISDALAAQVGGIGIAPGGNINYLTGHSIFEATHGTGPKLAGLNKANPSSVILSAEMMLRYMGWTEAADLLIQAIDRVISEKTVTFDLAEMISGSTELTCSAYGGQAGGNPDLTPVFPAFPSGLPSRHTVRRAVFCLHAGIYPIRYLLPGRKESSLMIPQAARHVAAVSSGMEREAGRNNRWSMPKRR